MKAIIYENGTKYASHVLAIKKAGWRTEVLVFNQERTRIRRVKMWKPERRVFIVDSGNFDCKARGWEGYADVLEDDALQKAVRFGKTADIEDFPQFKKYAEEITLAEWFEIEDERDIRSLMDVALDFHDSIPMRITAENADTEIEFDTTWNCTITLKFERVTASELIDRIGIIYDSTLEKTADGFIWKVNCFDSGRVGGTVDLLPCSKEPYIVCGDIKWSINPGKNTNSAKIKTYDDLYDFYCDLKTVSENVFIEGDKLIARHKNDTLAIEKRPNGYITYLNGKREKGLWEDGDITEYACEFLTQINPEDIQEEVLADTTAVKSLYVWHYMKCVLLFAALWSATGIILIFSANLHWALSSVIFFAPSLFVLIYSPCYLIKEKEHRYIITPGKIYYFYGNTSNMSLDISLIKDVKLHRSFIKSSTGTIKPKLKHGGNFGYAIIAADGAQEIYDLLKRLAEL